MNRNSISTSLRKARTTSIRIAIIGLLLLISTFVFSDQVAAQVCEQDDVLCADSCTAVGDCVGGFRCSFKVEQLVKPPLPDPRPIQVLSPDQDNPCTSGKGQAVLGGIEVPVGVWQYNPIGLNTSESIGIVVFISLLLRVFTILCGLWFMFNILIGGYTFITSSGDSAVFGKFKESLFYSLIGLFLIAVAYLIAGLVGTILFGDAMFIINPTLTQAGTVVAP